MSNNINSITVSQLQGKTNSKNFSRNYSEYLAKINCCPNKFPGEVGVEGPTGFDGPTGGYGLIGVRGLCGPMGPTGFDCTGPTGPPGSAGGLGLQSTNTTPDQGDTGPTGPRGAIINSVTGYTGVVFSGAPDYTLSLAPYGEERTYNISPTTYYSISVNPYGQSQISVPSNSTDFINTSATYTDIYNINYQVYVFNSSSSFTVNSPGVYVSMCLIGGGGLSSSVSLSGGASAGELLFADNYFLNSGTYVVTIGASGGSTILTQNSGSGSNILLSAAGGVDSSTTGAGSNGKQGVPGESTSSGGGGANNIGGTSNKILYKNIIDPCVNPNAQVWTYSNDGAVGSLTSGGGGGGAGGPGQQGIGGVGLKIYFDTDTGRTVCAGGNGSGTSATIPINGANNSGSAGSYGGNGGSGLFMLRYRIN
jgi:hypothetical protein